MLFDFDGVITNSMDLHYRAWQSVFTQFHVRINKLDFYKMEGIGISRVGETLAKKYNINLGFLPRLIREKRKYYKEIDNFQIYDHLIPFLNFLKVNNILMAVVTGGSLQRVQKNIKMHLDGYFSGIITPEKVKHTKPSPEPYLKGAESLGLSAGECLVIENAPLGIQSGKKAGMIVIAIQTTLPAKYLKQADYIVEDFIKARMLLEKLLN